jgi:hypothetical protein
VKRQRIKILKATRGSLHACGILRRVFLLLFFYFFFFLLLLFYSTTPKTVAARSSETTVRNHYQHSAINNSVKTSHYGKQLDVGNPFANGK